MKGAVNSNRSLSMKTSVTLSAFLAALHAPVAFAQAPCETPRARATASLLNRRRLRESCATGIFGSSFLPPSSEDTVQGERPVNHRAGSFSTSEI